jgi:hypothetical protein
VWMIDWVKTVFEGQITLVKLIGLSRHFFSEKWIKIKQKFQNKGDLCPKLFQIGFAPWFLVYLGLKKVSGDNTAVPLLLFLGPLEKTPFQYSISRLLLALDKPLLRSRWKYAFLKGNWICFQKKFCWTYAWSAILL